MRAKPFATLSAVMSGVAEVRARIAKADTVGVNVLVRHDIEDRLTEGKIGRYREDDEEQRHQAGREPGARAPFGVSQTKVR